jgi:cob(I)alamin adenosyltransferase
MMDNSLWVEVVKNLASVVAALGVIILGVIQLKSKAEARDNALVARTAADVVVKTAADVKHDLKSTVQTIEATAATVEQTAVKVATVQEQTDGNLTTIQNLLISTAKDLSERTKELKEQTEKVAKLTRDVQDLQKGK